MSRNSCSSLYYYFHVPIGNIVRYIYIYMCVCVYICKNTPVTSHGYSGQRSRTMAIKYPWLTSATVRDVSHCTRLKYFVPVTVRDFRHCTRDWNTITVTGHWRFVSCPLWYSIILKISIIKGKLKNNEIPLTHLTEHFIRVL